jgi:4-amino-4-deoxychorismate lyase
MPILAGTTVQAVFEVARRRGSRCQRRPLRVDDLLVAQGVWLLSSVTLAARVHTLDDVPLPAAAEAFDMTTTVDEAIGGQS